MFNIKINLDDFLDSVLLLELQVLLVEGVDTVNHLLDQLDLGVAQAVLVGDVIGVACQMSDHSEDLLCMYSILCDDLPVCPPDSPRVPLGCTCSSSHLFFRASRPSLVQPGRSTCTEALMPVPRLVGHEWM